MTLLEIIGWTKKANASATALRKALAEIDVDALERRVEELEAQRRDALLDDDDKAIERLDEQIRAAALNVERAVAAKSRLQERLEEAEADEREAARREKYAQAQKAAAEATKALKRYPDLARQIVEIIETVASAEAEIAAANGDLPAGAEPLPSAETAARGWPAIPSKEVRGRPRQAWFFAGDYAGWGEVQAGDLKELQQTTVNGGVVNRLVSDRPVRIPVELRTIIDIEVTPGQSAVEPAPLASQLQLPALHAGLPPIWSPASDPGFFAGGIGHFLDDVRRRLVSARDAIAAKPTDPRGMPSKERRVETVADQEEAA